MSNTTHWTERSTEDFLYSIASDFVEALKEKMLTLGMSQSKLAREAKVHKSFVSRIFKDPGNLTLDTIVKFARTVGMKVSILAYEDKADPSNTNGPLDSEIFRLCWEHAERPTDLWAIKEKNVAKTDSVPVDELLAGLQWGQFVFRQTSNEARPDTTRGFAGLPYRPLDSKKNTGSEWDSVLPIWR